MAGSWRVQERVSLSDSSFRNGSIGRSEKFSAKTQSCKGANGFNRKKRQETQRAQSKEPEQQGWQEN
jgi:hypothetical protein